MKKLCIIGFYLLLYGTECYSQLSESKDSVLINHVKTDDTNMMMDVMFKNDTVLPHIKSDNTISSDSIHESLFLNKDMFMDQVKFDMKDYLITTEMPVNQLIDQQRIKKNPPLFVPYSYSFDNFLVGTAVKGFHGSFSFTDFFKTDINIYISNTYIRYPSSLYFYLNGSISTKLIFKLHERVQLIGLGQLSLREGFNPKMPTLLDGANYYGAGVQYKITNHIGIGVGFTNNYYRGEWTKRTYLVPVGY